MRRTLFLLSPASTAGRRSGLLLSPRGRFDLAVRMRSGTGVAIGEVFAFLSGLYFRGKLTYARRFADPGCIRVITSDRGLLPPEQRITLDDLRAMAESRIDAANPTYRAPLARDAAALARELGEGVRPVLLGSIATGKYADVLHDGFAGRLEFPVDFVGRGDMSRGGLMLRSAESGSELVYVRVAEAIRTGKRPARLPPKKPSAKR